MLKRDHDSALDVFDRGCLVLRRGGHVAGHLATLLSTFWSPGRPLTLQDRVWFVVVWDDGERESLIEDYPPWSYVTEIQAGVLVWESGPHQGAYTVAWLSDGEAAARWEALGITVDEF